MYEYLTLGNQNFKVIVPISVYLCMYKVPHKMCNLIVAYDQLFLFFIRLIALCVCACACACFCICICIYFVCCILKDWLRGPLFCHSI